MTIRVSQRRIELLLTSAMVAALAVPAASEINPFPVLSNVTGASGGADIPDVVPADTDLLIGLPDSQPKTVILWDSFDIAAGKTVEFEGIYTCPMNCGPIKPPLGVLNRVIGSDGSDIYGTLKSEPNIEVFLINPNGIIFGPTAKVDVGSFLASTLDMQCSTESSNCDEYVDGGEFDPFDESVPGDPTLYYIFGTTDGHVSSDIGITVEGGALITTNTGALTLLGGFVHEDAGASIMGATDVGIAAANYILVPADAGSRLSFRFYNSTLSPDAITIAGAVSGQNVAAFMETDTSVQNALLFIADTGSITATEDGTGGIFLNIGARADSGAASVVTNSPGGIRNEGTLNATGDVVLRGERSGGVWYEPRFVVNNGSIEAGDDVQAFADDDIINGGSITAGGDVILSAVGDILNSSAVLDGLDPAFNTTDGSIEATDVSLSAGGSILMGSITARDDIAIRADGTVTTGSLTSGATIDGTGPVDVSGAADALLETNLAGHDVDVDGSAIFPGVVRAIGTGSDIRLGTPIELTVDDVDLAAGGDITIDGDVSGVDVAMQAGGTITADDISARDDIALIAGDTLDVGTLSSGVSLIDPETDDVLPPVDQAGSADALLNETLAGHDLYVQGGSVDLAQAIANGAGSDLTVRATTGGLNIDDGEAGGTIALVKEGTTGILTAGTLLAGTGASLTSETDIDAVIVETDSGDLNFVAGGDVNVVNPLNADDVAISAGGTITTDDISARDDIALIAGDSLDVGTLTSGVAIDGTGPVDTTGAADALLEETLAGHDLYVQGGSVDLAQAVANGAGSDLTVRATTGGLNIDDGEAGGTITLVKEGATGILTAGTLLAGTGATLQSDTDIDVQTAQTVTGDLAFSADRDVAVHSALGADDVAIEAGRNINTGDISARDDIALRAGDTLNTGTLASGVAIGGTGPVDTVGAADALLGETLGGHDLYVQGGSVDLAQAIANGAGSDLTVRATTGGLNIDDGEAGGTITLVKQGATGILTAGTLLAGTGATLQSDTDIDVQTAQTVTGDLAFSADRDVTVHSALGADDVAIEAGRNINTGDISARDDIALRAGDTLNTGTLASGVAIGGTGPVDTAGAADALLGGTLGGHDLFAQAGHLTLPTASANGAGSDLTLRATNGDVTIGTGTAGGNVSVDATGRATVGTLVAQAGDVDILADDLDILAGITGSQVSITNREGGNLVTVLGDASATGAFTLTEAELNLIHTSTLNIDSLDQNLLVGNVAFGNDVGSTRINLLGTGRVDIVGELDASGVTRTLQIGGTLGTADPNDPSTLASIIRIAPTSSGGGRILLGDGALDLRGAKIGVGLDDGFLQPLGLMAGGTPASTEVVQEDWIGDFNSTLYGIPGGYADPTVISAGSITVTYTDYALFQNTGSGSNRTGVDAGMLTIVSSGDEGNGFELFGTIDAVGGRGAAFLVQPTAVSMGNSRINGCLILTGGGCGGEGPGFEPPPETLPPVPPGTNDDGDGGGDPFGGAGSEFAQQDLISTDEDKAFDFDSLVGTNNEGLLGVVGVDDANAPEQCTPDDKREICRREEKAHEQ